MPGHLENIEFIHQLFFSCFYFFSIINSEDNLATHLLVVINAVIDASALKKIKTNKESKIKEQMIKSVEIIALMTAVTREYLAIKTDPLWQKIAKC